MSSLAKENEADSKLPDYLFATFLESAPPGTRASIPDLAITRRGYDYPFLATPLLQLHCSSEECNGVRYFQAVSKDQQLGEQISNRFLEVRCRNCHKLTRTYALIVIVDPNESAEVVPGLAIKIGEVPAFGPPVPSRAITLVGPDRELFLRGRRAENLGLGVGAFAYYRRVIENQKSRLIGEILRVAERTKADSSVISKLQSALSEPQFAKAVERTKDAIPPALLIDGHNPLRLLHQALSEGIHDLSDEDCLSLAASIRVVLYELAERSGAVLKDHEELRAAMSRLLNRERPSE